MKHIDKFNKEFNNITDVFSGDDGGVPFIKARAFLLDMASMADEGDVSAAGVLDIVYRFNKLLTLAMNPPKHVFIKNKQKK